MPKFEIKNRVALVTGASMGIGKATALSFAKEGGKIALAARSEPALKEVAEQIKNLGGTAEIFPFDLSQIPKITEMVDAVRKKLGPVDILINNAGYAVTGLVEDCPIEQYRKNFEVNFYAPLALIQAVLPDMKSKRSGQIINVSSGVGRRALPGVSAYSSTKFALNGLTESLRLEVKKYGIDVIAIFPGRVSSRFHENMQNYGRLQRKLPPTPMSAPEELGEFILNASKRRLREATVSGPGKIGYHLNYWAPSLVDRILAQKFPV